MRTDGVHCRESDGTEPVVLKLVPVTGAAFSGVTMDHLMWPLFLHTHFWYVVDMCDTVSIGLCCHEPLGP